MAARPRITSENGVSWYVASSENSSTAASGSLVSQARP